jgi:hypothetical protein
LAVAAVAAVDPMLARLKVVDRVEVEAALES